MTDQPDRQPARRPLTGGDVVVIFAIAFLSFALVFRSWGLI